MRAGERQLVGNLDALHDVCLDEVNQCKALAGGIQTVLLMVPHEAAVGSGYDVCINVGANTLPGGQAVLYLPCNGFVGRHKEGEGLVVRVVQSVLAFR